MDAVRITRTPDPYERSLLALGYRVGDLILLSGHASLDDEARFVPGDFAAQAGCAIDGLEKTLRAAGASLHAVVKLTAYVTDIAAQRPALIDLIGRRFRRPGPALTVVEIRMARHPEWLVEIEALALANGVRRER